MNVSIDRFRARTGERRRRNGRTEVRRLLLRPFLFALAACAFGVPPLLFWRIFADGPAAAAPRPPDGLPSVAPTAAPRRYEAVSCPRALALAADPGFYDPNRGMPEPPARLTTTDPPFRIVLFKQYYDRARWASIYVKGEYYERGLTQIFKEVLAPAAGIAPGLVLDLGANVGWFSLWSRAMGHSVAAFDPNPLMHVRICESLALNGWSDGDAGEDSRFFQMFSYGVADVEASMNLTTGNNPGGSSFLPERLALKHRKTIPARVVQLDDVARGEGWLSDAPSSLPIHLMKVDVEGYEHLAMAGAEEILSSGKVANVLTENTSQDVEAVLSLLGQMYRCGYGVHALLDVNGDPYHNDAATVANVNKAIRDILPGMDPEDFKAGWMITVSNNIWWKRRDI